MLSLTEFCLGCQLKRKCGFTCIYECCIASVYLILVCANCLLPFQMWCKPSLYIDINYLVLKTLLNTVYLNYNITTRSFPYRPGPIWVSRANMGVSFLDVGSM